MALNPILSSTFWRVITQLPNPHPVPAIYQEILQTPQISNCVVEKLIDCVARGMLVSTVNTTRQDRLIEMLAAWGHQNTADESKQYNYANLVQAHRDVIGFCLPEADERLKQLLSATLSRLLAWCKQIKHWLKKPRIYQVDPTLVAAFQKTDIEAIPQALVQTPHTVTFVQIKSPQYMRGYIQCDGFFVWSDLTENALSVLFTSQKDMFLDVTFPRYDTLDPFGSQLWDSEDKKILQPWIQLVVSSMCYITHAKTPFVAEYADVKARQWAEKIKTAKTKTEQSKYKQKLKQSNQTQTVYVTYTLERGGPIDEHIQPGAPGKAVDFQTPVAGHFRTYWTGQGAMKTPSLKYILPHVRGKNFPQHPERVLTVTPVR